MDYIIDNVEFITELVKSGFIGIVGIFFIGLAICGTQSLDLSHSSIMGSERKRPFGVDTI